MHEFGHFWVALKRGLVVEEFAIGFGPIIWSKEKDGILYTIRCIPAGGFVKLPQMLTSEAIEGKADVKEDDKEEEGENEDSNEPLPEPLPQVSPFSKILVAFAGPLMTLVFAMIIYINKDQSKTFTYLFAILTFSMLLIITTGERVALFY